MKSCVRLSGLFEFSVRSPNFGLKFLKFISVNFIFNHTKSKITTWTVGKCELYHWVAVLDRFDTLLEKACSTREKNKWQYLVDENNQLKELVLGILNFTALLIEYSCSRHIYGSIDHIITLLCVADLDVTLSGIISTT